MAKKNKTIDERLLDAQVAIDNALNDKGILDAMSVYAYNAARINEGKKLFTEAQELVNQQKKEYGEQYEASENVSKAWDKSNNRYMKTLKVARIALKDDAKAQTSLMLTGKRKVSLPGWIEQAEAFYSNLTKDSALMSKMSSFGYNTAKLNDEYALVKNVITSNNEQEKEKGEAQDATKKRDAKMEKLDEWMSDFKGIAFVALDENPQWLEKLGYSGIE